MTFLATSQQKEKGLPSVAGIRYLVNNTELQQQSVALPISPQGDAWHVMVLRQRQLHCCREHICMCVIFFALLFRCIDDCVRLGTNRRPITHHAGTVELLSDGSRSNAAGRGWCWCPASVAADTTRVTVTLNRPPTTPRSTVIIQLGSPITYLVMSNGARMGSARPRLRNEKDWCGDNAHTRRRCERFPRNSGARVRDMEGRTGFGRKYRRKRQKRAVGGEKTQL